MKFILLILLMLNGTLNAECLLTRKSDFKVGFKAFKTPLKIGVGGTFDDLLLSNAKKSASNLNDLLIHTKVTINIQSVNTANGARDAKLVSYFFNQMKTKEITAEIIKLKGDSLNGYVWISMNMNGVVREVPMKYIVKGGKFSAKGVIDVADFSALNALKSINKACFVAHKGKTWQDVVITFSFELRKSCKI